MITGGTADGKAVGIAAAKWSAVMAAPWRHRRGTASARCHRQLGASAAGCGRSRPQEITPTCVISPNAMIIRRSSPDARWDTWPAPAWPPLRCQR
jgi:hypothetical protein